MMRSGPVVQTVPLPEAEAAQQFDFDLVVIGGGSGGLAASKEAAQIGAKVAVLDYVSPSPQGTTWGLGGTCVNVGCIPKKLMHRAALVGEQLHDAQEFGWGVEPENVHFNWDTLVQAVTNHVRSLNFGYRKSLRENNVKYINAQGSFVNNHTIKCTYFDKAGKTVVKEEQITSKYIIVAVGGRPKFPDTPGAVEHCISSDDLFWMKNSPGKTLVVGASYVALECAGFIRSLGYEVTIRVRSILLRGFDQQMADKIGKHMESIGVVFKRQSLPTKIEKLESGKLRVVCEGEDPAGEEFDTVLYAVGRAPCTSTLGLENAGVTVDSQTSKIPVSTAEQTNIPSVFAIGDVALYPNPLFRMLELTPVAIKAGRALSQRLFAGSNEGMDYLNIPTTVFTPLEYGCVGMSEEMAQDAFAEDLEVYHSTFTPLEWTVPHLPTNSCYCKVLCNKGRNEEVVGIHYLGPNAGEVIQGYTFAVKCGVTKKQFDSVVGIHPTCSEELVSLTTTKSSGEDESRTGC
eukprot:c9907_g1_i1.p1 GENE.c9907_g1_i1~~c9907_g1_i1.p1  ORF type:complete len:515 (+),score=153.00 c9907_g1_i1:31-1575(+)